MPSPFPGMDPYLESSGVWPDFHSTFMNVWREAIADRLPEDYVARLEERLTISEEEEVRQFIQAIPDVMISQNRSPRVSGGAVTLVEPTLEPVRIPYLIADPQRTTYIEVFRRSDEKLVTVLELLSPTNKSASGRSQYLSKRHAVMRSETHFVELDLLVGGRRMQMGKPWPPGRYYYLVSRADEGLECEVYSWGIGDRLPAVPVPLSEPDPDIVCDLSAVLTTTYQRGRYEKSIKYGQPLDLPLSTQEQTWVESVLEPKPKQT